MSYVKLCPAELARRQPERRPQWSLTKGPNHTHRLGGPLPLCMESRSPALPRDTGRAQSQDNVELMRARLRSRPAWTAGEAEREKGNDQWRHDIPVEKSSSRA